MLPTHPDAMKHPRYGEVARRMAAALGAFDMLTPGSPLGRGGANEKAWLDDLARCLEYAAAAARAVKP